MQKQRSKVVKPPRCTVTDVSTGEVFEGTIGRCKSWILGGTHGAHKSMDIRVTLFSNPIDIDVLFKDELKPPFVKFIRICEKCSYARSASLCCGCWKINREKLVAAGHSVPEYPTKLPSKKHNMSYAKPIKIVNENEIETGMYRVETDCGDKAYQSMVYQDAVSWADIDIKAGRTPVVKFNGVDVSIEILRSVEFISKHVDGNKFGICIGLNGTKCTYLTAATSRTGLCSACHKRKIGCPVCGASSGRNGARCMKCVLIKMRKGGKI